METDKEINDIYIVRKCLAKKAYSVANSENCEKYIGYLEDDLAKIEKSFSTGIEKGFFEEFKESFLEGTSWTLNLYANKIGGENAIGLIRERRDAIRKAGNELPFRHIANAYDRISNLYDNFTKQAP